MIPVVNKRGFSFKGVTEYLGHDKKAQTSERVAWTETGNLYTDDIEKASRVMAWTDLNADELKRESGGSMAGRKTETGSVYHYSLSWAHDENPDKEHQKEQVFATLEKLGLADNQFYMVAHNDTKHSHVHVVVNLTNQETGKRTDPHLDKRALQEWALGYEKEHGMYCEQREANAQLRTDGQTQKYTDQKQDYSVKITRAYHASDSGKAFVNALEAEGLHLGKARRGNSFVVVDEKGEIQKLSRQLDIEQRGKAKTTAINTKLADIDRNDVPDADELAKAIKAGELKIARSSEEVPEGSNNEDLKMSEEKEIEIEIEEQEEGSLDDDQQVKNNLSEDNSIEAETGENIQNKNLEAQEEQTDQREEILSKVEEGVEKLEENNIKPTEKMVDIIMDTAEKSDGERQKGVDIEHSILDETDVLIAEHEAKRETKHDGLVDTVEEMSEQDKVQEKIQGQKQSQEQPPQEQGPRQGQAQEDDLFERFNSPIHSVNESKGVSHDVNNPFRQSDPFKQSNPFDGRSGADPFSSLSNSFGDEVEQSETNMEMKDGFKNELDGQEDDLFSRMSSPLDGDIEQPGEDDKFKNELDNGDTEKRNKGQDRGR